MDRAGGRTAIVVPIELPPALEAIRHDHVEVARLGVPAHVTVLFPFVAAAALSETDVELAMRAIRGTTAFDVEFRQAKSFDGTPAEGGVVWLAPEPPAPFIELTQALVGAFPGYLPYEGIHDTVIPHLTLANVDVDVPALVSTTRASLPFRRSVKAAALLVEDDAGRWRIDRALPLG